MRVLIGYVQSHIVLTIQILSTSQRQLRNKCCQLMHERGIPPFCQKGTHQRKESNKILIVLLTKRIFKYSTHGVLLSLVSEQDAVNGMNGQFFNYLIVKKWGKKEFRRKMDSPRCTERIQKQVETSVSIR